MADQVVGMRRVPVVADDRADVVKQGPIFKQSAVIIVELVLGLEAIEQR